MILYQRRPQAKDVSSLVVMTSLIVMLVLCDDIINIGFVAPLTGKMGFEQTASAASMAVQQAKSEGLLNGSDVRFFYMPVNCSSGKMELGATFDLHRKHSINAFVGYPCSLGAEAAGMLLSVWNIPHLTYSSISIDLTNKMVYNTLIRMMSPLDHMIKCLGQLFVLYAWSSVVIVSAENTDEYCHSIDAHVADVFGRFNLSVAETIDLDDDVVTDINDEIFAKISETGRIVLLCGSTDFVKAFMLAAHKHGMTDGQYVFIATNVVQPDNVYQPSLINYTRDSSTMAPYFPLLQICVSSVETPAAKKFLASIPVKLAESPWSYNRSLEQNISGSLYAPFLKDAVYVYLKAMNQMKRSGLNYNDGRKLREIATNITFVGESGPVMLDQNSDRLGKYSVYHIPKGGTTYQLLVEFEMISGSIVKAGVPVARYWGPSGFGAPQSNPMCGFNGDLCRTSSLAVILATTLLCSATMIAMMIVVSICRGRQPACFEVCGHNMMTWEITYEDLDFVSNVATSVISIASGTGSGEMSFTAAAIGGIRGTAIQLAHYKGLLVTVKRLKAPLYQSQLLTAKDIAEVLMMKALKHENLNEFIGVCNAPDHFYLVMAYCSKGSLQEILDNNTFVFDRNFKLAFIFDLLTGVLHLHNSPLKSHGWLKATNCVVNSQWRLQITDYGMQKFRNRMFAEADDENITAMYWMAPELLRAEVVHFNGTQTGDMYSVAMLMYYIVYRTAPFRAEFDADLRPRDIIRRICNGEMPPHRPRAVQNEGVMASTSRPVELQGDDVVDPRLVDLMKQCWSEDDLLRPTIASALGRFNVISRLSRNKLADTLLDRMEKYTVYLESVMEERNRELVLEKAKTDSLLYKMMPVEVADALKSGLPARPELFSEASVFFSIIHEFEEWLVELTPVEISDLLDRLWVMFDEVIARYDVYKVETIGDSYMVSSGVPKQNAQHATALANMALDIIDHVPAFPICSNGSRQRGTVSTNRARTERHLAVCIGINSGPVVGAVIGRTMPRYCLFGDTVNVASRLESNGLPQRIHISERTYYILLQSGRHYIMSKRGQISLKGHCHAIIAMINNRIVTFDTVLSTKQLRLQRFYDMGIARHFHQGKDGLCTTYWLNGVAS